VNGLSLRARLLAGVSVVVIVLAVVAAVITTTTRSQLIEQIDGRLASAASDGRGSAFDRGPGGGEPDSHGGDEPEPPVGAPPERQSDFYEGSIDGSGDLTTFFVPNVGGEVLEPPVITTDQLDLVDEDVEYFTASTADGSVRYRVRAVRGGSDGGAFVTALPLNDVESTIDRLMLIELAGVAAILAVLGLVTWWMLWHGIRPIKQMTTTASVIAGGDLSARADESTPAAESRQLAVALNTMLATIETAMDERAESEARLRRFVSDASHELRTPMTTIRGYAELYRAGGLSDPDALDDAMRRTAQESQRMTRLVEDMLTLARLDEERPIAHEPVDLAMLCRDAATDAHVAAPDREVVVEAPGSVVVSGDEDRLRQVLANLVGNAIAHTEPGVSVLIRVHVEQSPDGAGDAAARAVTEVIDSGAGMAAETAERVTERFFRADPSRSRHRGGTGLGLSIVDATVRAHGGTVRIDSGPGRGTTVSFDLPLFDR
jgi:two-component system OmpR family sensor kinase